MYIIKPEDYEKIQPRPRYTEFYYYLSPVQRIVYWIGILSIWGGVIGSMYLAWFSAVESEYLAKAFTVFFTLTSFGWGIGWSMQAYGIDQHKEHQAAYQRKQEKMELAETLSALENQIQAFSSKQEELKLLLLFMNQQNSISQRFDQLVRSVDQQMFSLNQCLSNREDEKE